MRLLPIHQSFLDGALPRLQADDRLVGAAIGGSALTDSIDEFSDLDLVVAVEPPFHRQVLEQATTIASELGPLLSAFTGEHVGEPRLLICCYGPSILHVDLKFISIDDLAARVEDPIVLWERDRRLTAVIEATEARYPQPDIRWIEDRFWTWIHYGAARIGRGELLEALDMLAFLRARVLGPLALLEAGERPSRVRRIEMLAPRRAAELQQIVGGVDVASCTEALARAARLYQELRDQLGAGVPRQSRMEEAALAYLHDIRARISPLTRTEAG